MAASAKASSALTVTLPSDREVLLTRVFDAPPELLFEAFTKPEHLRHWFGRRDWTMAECEVDLKVGGAWRYLLLGPKEQKLGMHGVYREIQRPERLVYTEAFDEFPGESVVTTTLTEENGRTTLSSRVLCASKKVRDMVIDSGMERGAAETYDRLAEHLATIPRAGIAGPELVVARLFHAPRELVFECWTTPEHLRHWQGAPRGFTVTSSESDIRPGGFFRICMRSPEGVDHWLEGHYREIVKPERLVFTHAWLDAGRKFGKETLVTITFTERDGGTELALHQTGFHSAESRDGHKYGWTSALDVLVDYLAGLQPRAAVTESRVMVATRVFDAPRDLVFRAWTDGDQLQRWWGPKGFTNPVCQVDVRPGGAIRIDMRAPDGTVYPITGRFVEIAEPERLVFISSALDANGEPLFEVLNTVTFEEEAGKTKLTVTASVSKTRPDAARYLAGMEQGWTQTLDRLGERLAEEVRA